MGIQTIGVNVGDNADDTKFQNKRAEIYWRSREWLRTGGEVSKGIKKELDAIKYKNTIRNKIQIMGKEEMRRRGVKSPNNADAFSLTFCFGVQKNG